MDIIIVVDNIKCSGCANSIRTGLLKIPGVISVEVDIGGESVLIAADQDVRLQAIERLAAMGYPEKGQSEGLAALSAKARSFVSCAVGRFEKGKT
jgi:copper chaperone